MKTSKWSKAYLFPLVVVWFMIYGCASLKPATVVNKEAIRNYKYYSISSSNSLTSSTGFSYGGQYYSSGKSVNPTDVITGIMSKEGFIRLPTLQDDLIDQTLIVNYGESGRRGTGLGGYTIEVTIQFISANSKTPICSCTAEGQGATEADDIRQAITRCLKGLLEK